MREGECVWQPLASANRIECPPPNSHITRAMLFQHRFHFAYYKILANDLKDCRWIAADRPTAK